MVIRREVLLQMFEKVSRSLKYDSKFFFVDTTTDHFTPLAQCVRGKNATCVTNSYLLVVEAMHIVC